MRSYLIAKDVARPLRRRTAPATSHGPYCDLRTGNPIPNSDENSPEIASRSQASSARQGEVVRLLQLLQLDLPRLRVEAIRHAARVVHLRENGSSRQGLERRPSSSHTPYHSITNRWARDSQSVICESLSVEKFPSLGKMELQHRSLRSCVHDFRRPEVVALDNTLRSIYVKTLFTEKYLRTE